MAGLPDRRGPFIRQVQAEGLQLCFGVGGEANGDHHVADHIFENQIPPDDPGENFSQRGVGIGVGAAGDGDHRSQLGITESGKAASQRDQEERDGDGGAGWRASMHENLRCAASTQEVHNDVEHLGVKNGRGLKIFSGSSGPGEHEDAGTDHGADAQRGQRPGPERFLQTLSGRLRFGDQLIDRFAAEKLVGGSADGGSGFRGWLRHSGCCLLRPCTHRQHSAFSRYEFLSQKETSRPNAKCLSLSYRFA